MNAVIANCLYGKTVAVAVSGGADSMALLHYLLSVADKYDIKVAAVNVEHGIRGESSLRDTAFVKNYCEQNDVPVFTYRVNAPSLAKKEKLSLEQAARILRYDCFFDAVNTGKCDAVVTAHHSSDNFESALFNLFRGTGVKGLIGIKDFDGKIFRPFIGVTKEEINAYVAENSIPFVTDESNLKDDFSRNFLRLNVIPKIKERFPDAEKSVLRLAETLAEEDEFLDTEARKYISTNVPEKDISIKLPLHKALLSRSVIFALKDLGLKKDYEKIHVDDVCALLGKQTGKTVCLPLGIKAVKEYDRIRMFKDVSETPVEKPFSVGVVTVNGLTVETTFDTPADLTKGLYADYDKIPPYATLRTKRAGDVFTKFGGGTKSLSDILTDKKIPLKDRNSLLLLADGNRVLAIIGIAVSDNIKVDANTKKIIKFIIQRT